MSVRCCVLLLFLLIHHFSGYSHVPAAWMLPLSKELLQTRGFTLCFIGSLRHSSTARIKSHVLKNTFLFHVLGKASGYEKHMDRCVTGLKKMKDFSVWLSVYFIFICFDLYLTLSQIIFLVDIPRKVQGLLNFTLIQCLLSVVHSSDITLPVTAEHNGQVLPNIPYTKLFSNSTNA